MKKTFDRLITLTVLGLVVYLSVESFSHFEERSGLNALRVGMVLIGIGLSVHGLASIQRLWAIGSNRFTGKHALFTAGVLTLTYASSI